MDNTKISEIITNIFGLIGLTEDQFEVSFDPDETISVKLKLSDEHSGLFVGHHGEGIASLRLLLGLIINQRFSVWPKLRVNVNDYLEKREESLQELAQNAADKAIELQREIILPNLSSFERRIVHLYLESIPGVASESRGEEPYRQLVVVPKASA